MLTARLDAELARLLPHGPPFAVAYSGGGDSTALLHVLRDRAALALTVDHRMSEGSTERTAEAVARAEAMGVRTIALAPDTPPAKRTQAAARVLRYTLMGEALRAEGIAHLLLAHTLDDQAETAAMRALRDPNGYRTMAAVSHAPVWPALRGIDLVRPLRMTTRAELRGYLRKHGLDWIEDPANRDRRHERVRVRESAPSLDPSIIHEDDRKRRAAAEAMFRLVSTLTFQPGWIEAPLDTPPDLLELASRCAAGSPVHGARGLGTSGGARIVERDNLLLTTDPGTVFGREKVAPLSRLHLVPGEARLWSNRFLIRTDQPRLCVEPLGTRWPKGHPRPPVAVRRTLPGLFRGDTLVGVPGWGEGEFRYLAEERLRRTLAVAMAVGSVKSPVRKKVWWEP